MLKTVGKFTCPPALIVFVVATSTIVAAWGFELIGGYIPCPLCLQQRWPYYAVIPLSLLILLISRAGAAAGFARIGLVLCGVIMLRSAWLGAEHAGVEWGWWPGPSECASGAGLSSDTILPDLDNPVIVRCDEVQWRLLGLSFAGWNFVVSLITAIIAFSGALQMVKR